MLGSEKPWFLTTQTGEFYCVLLGFCGRAC